MIRPAGPASDSKRNRAAADQASRNSDKLSADRIAAKDRLAVSQTIPLNHPEIPVYFFFLPA